MEENESFCLEHGLPFTKCCMKCELLFCNKCPPHLIHTTLSLLYAVTPEYITNLIEEANKIIYSIDAALHIIAKVSDDLMLTFDSNKEELSPLDEDKGDFTARKELEYRVNDQIKELAVITSAYEALKLKLHKHIEHLKQMLPLVESMFHKETSEALKTIMELRGLPRFLKDSHQEVGELNKRMESVSSSLVKQEIWQRQTFQEFEDYINNLEKTIPHVEQEALVTIEKYSVLIPRLKKEIQQHKKASEKPMKMNEGKRLRTNLRIRELEAELKSFKKEKEGILGHINGPIYEQKMFKAKTKELQEAKDSLEVLKAIHERADKDIIDIPYKLLKAKEELNIIMRRRKQEQKYAIKCIDKAKQSRDWLKKTISEKKDKMKIALKQQKCYTNFDALTKICITEKRVLLENVKKRLEHLKEDRENFSVSLEDTQEQIRKITEYCNQLERNNILFQSSIDKLQLEQMVPTLNDIEKAKKDIKEIGKVNRTELVQIMNNLISTKNDIETIITQKQEELKKLIDIPIEPGEEVYELMDKYKISLESLKEFLEKEINKDRTLEPICADGRPGKVKLKCGHNLCYKCFFQQKAKSETNNNTVIVCLDCGGLLQEIGNSPQHFFRVCEDNMWM